MRKDTGHPGNIRLAAALDSVRPFAENDPEQLWFQLQARTRLVGWEDLQAQLNKQMPPDTLIAMTSSLEPANPAVLRTWRLSEAAVTHLGYSSDGARVYFGSVDGKMLVVDSKTLEVVKRREGMGAIMGTASGANGEVAICALDRNVLRASGIENNEDITELGHYQTAIGYLGNCPMTPGFLVDLARGEVTLDVDRFQIVRTSLADPASSLRFQKPTQAAFNRALFMQLDKTSGNLDVADDYGQFWRFSSDTGQLVSGPIRVILGKATGYGANSAGTSLASCCAYVRDNGRVRPGAIACLDLNTLEVKFQHQVEEAPLAVSFLGDGKTLVAGGLRGSLSIFPPPAVPAKPDAQAAVPQGQGVVAQDQFAAPAKSFAVFADPVTRILTSTEGEKVFVGSVQGFVKLVDTSARDWAPKPLPRKTAITRRAISPDDVWEADFSSNKVNIREVSSGLLVHELKTVGSLVRQLGDVTSTALNPSGPSAVLGGTNGIVHWNLASGETKPVAIDTSWSMQDGSNPSKGQPPKLSVLVSPDGKYAVVFSRKSVAVYDANSGEQIAVTTLDVRYFTEPYSFLPNDRFAVSYQGFLNGVRIDGVRVFDLISGKQIANLVHGAEVRGVGFSRKTGVIVTFGKREHKDRNEDRKFATWQPDSQTPELTDLTEPDDTLVGMTDDGRRVLALNLYGSAQSALTVYDWATRSVIRRFHLEIDVSVDPRFDGRTLTLVTQDRQRHLFEFHQD